MPMEFDKLLVTGVERGASDLHLKANAPVILRIHGRLVPQGDLGVITAEDMDAIAHRCLTERMYAQLMDGREVDSAYAVPNFGRFRVNMFLALGSVRAVLRSIPSKKPKFEELGLPEVLEHLSMERRGLLLVTGITGSGKSTTLAAMVDYINRTRNDHIIAIKDCIREAKRTPEIPAFIAQGQSQYGMQTFDQCLLKLYRDGIISYETAREAATNADDFDLKVRGIFSTGEQSFEQRTTERAPLSPTGSSFFKRS